MKLKAILKRRWPIVAICMLVGAVAGLVSSQFAQQANGKAIYTAQQVVLAKANAQAAQDVLKVTRGPVLALAAKQLQITGSTDELAAKVNATYDGDTGSITITSNDIDPKAATRRVDAFVQAFLEVVVDEIQADDRAELSQIEADLKTTKDALAQFDSLHPEFTQPGALLPNDAQTAILRTDRQNLGTRISELEASQRDLGLVLRQNRPYEALGPETPRPAATDLIEVPASAKARAALIGFLGMLFGAGLAMVLERMGRLIDTRDELAEVCDLPILTEVSFLSSRQRSVTAGGRLMLNGGWAEPFRRLRSAVQFIQTQESAAIRWRSEPSSLVNADSIPAVFMVTSARPGEGKSTTSVLLAIALAEVGVPTVLIGGDFRKPQIDRHLGVPRSPSLQDLALLDIQRPSIDDVVQQTEFRDLYVAVAGEPTREVAGLAEAARAVCAEAVARGATVIIDSSPIQATNDALDLLPIADYVILVVRAGKTNAVELLDTIGTLKRMDSKILGIVLIGTLTARTKSYYDYYDDAATPASQADRPV